MAIIAITNLLAFTAYFPDASLAALILGNKGIDPALTDQNEVSSAWGMLEKAKGSDYSQGRTSETISNLARKRLISDAKAILSKNGIVYLEDHPALTNGISW
jgi:hypothetical protein